MCSPQHSATVVDAQSPQAPTHTHEAIKTYYGYYGIPQHGGREAVSTTLVRCWKHFAVDSLEDSSASVLRRRCKDVVNTGAYVANTHR